MPSVTSPGGGFYENVPRMMTQGLTAQIDLSTFPRLPIFDLIQKTGGTRSVTCTTPTIWASA